MEDSIGLPEEGGRQTTAKTGKEGTSRAKAANNLLQAAGTLALPASQIGIDVPATIEALATIGARVLPALSTITLAGDTPIRPKPLYTEEESDADIIDKDIAFKEPKAPHTRFTGNRPPIPNPPKIPPALIPIAAAASQQKERIQQAAEPVVTAMTRAEEYIPKNWYPIINRFNTNYYKAANSSPYATISGHNERQVAYTLIDEMKAFLPHHAQYFESLKKLATEAIGRKIEEFMSNNFERYL